MPTSYREFDTTPAAAVADIKAAILTSTDWAQVGAANVVRNIAPNGAQLAVDLADAAATAMRLQLGVYRTHDGTTGVDKVLRYVQWRNAGGATTDPLHCVVSAGPGHLYLSVEGPRSGEPNAVSTQGSGKQVLALCEVLPYFTGGAAAVACIGQLAGNAAGGDRDMHVSRNHGNTLSWVPAKLASLNFPNAGNNTAWTPPGLTRRSVIDGNDYLWPYVVVESGDGLRGRLKQIHYVGPSAPTGGEQAAMPGERFTFGGVNYIAVEPYRGHSGSVNFGALGAANNGNASIGPIVAVPI